MNTFDIFLSLTKVLISAKKVVNNYNGDDPFILELSKEIADFRKNYAEETGAMLEIITNRT